MKNTAKYIMITLTAVFIAACHINEPEYVYDNRPPDSPSGIVVYNGDNRVDISWIHNNERDLSGYNVYYAYSYDGTYTLLGSTSDNYFIDYGAVNGETYYYAVAAFDFNGNESELSYDVAYATPRPEGFDQAIFDYLSFPNKSGYSFTDYQVVPYDDEYSDFFFENYDGTYYLDVWDDTDIQDMGPTNDIYDIEFAPTTGWNETKDAIAHVGHTYVIWTWDNHFAKIRVNTITRDRVVFDWAFQLVEGNKMLKAKTVPAERGKLKRTNNRGNPANIGK